MIHNKTKRIQIRKNKNKNIRKDNMQFLNNNKMKPISTKF